MTDKTFIARHKVRGYECDYYGHVNNATYLNYLEYARGECLTEAGLSLSALKAAGFIIVIRRINITYRTSAEINDLLKIRTRVKEHSGATCTFLQEIVREADEKRIAEAEVTWTVINENGRPVRIPQQIKDALALES